MSSKEPKEQIATGLPGFLIDDELHDMSVGDPNRNAIVEKINLAQKKGSIKIDLEPKDIALNTKKKMSDYLGKSTLKKNYLTLDSEVLEETSIFSRDGSYVPDILPTKNSNFFVDKEKIIPEGEPRELRGWHAGRQSGIKAEDVGLAKGRRENWESGITGNDILNDKNATSNYVSSILTRNRFAPQLDPNGNGWIKKTNDLYDVLTAGSVSETIDALNPSEIYAGSFQDLSTSENNFNPVIYHPRYGEFRINSLSNIFSSMQKKDVGSVANALGEIKKAVDDIEEYANQFSSISSTGLFSKFANFFTPDMSDATLVILSYAFVKLVIDIILQKSIDLNQELLDIADLLGIDVEYYDFDFVACVGRGMELVFSPEEQGIDVKSPPYVISTCKSIISSYQIFLSEISKQPNGENPIFWVTDALKKSRLFNILKVFADLGNIVLRFEYNLSEIDPEKRYHDDENQFDTKFKIKGGRPTVSKNFKWATKNSISTFLPEMPLTPILFNGGKFDPEFQGHEGINSIGTTANGARGRINLEQVSIIENNLDAEYMPFYFHDLRTNEILSFHAFLYSLSDGFSANYESIEGFGRVEPVKIYKGTQRKIGMEFAIVATSEEDFDHMWKKINKLTTMIYPQYTEGKRLKTDAGYDFIQPFSQMMSASPLIRIRLGNILHSNYSRFALAKLFGANLNDTSFKENENAQKATENAALKVREARKNAVDWITNEPKWKNDLKNYLENLGINDKVCIKKIAGAQYKDRKIKPKLHQLYGKKSFITGLIFDIIDIEKVQGTTTKDGPTRRIFMPDYKSLAKEMKEKSTPTGRTGPPREGQMSGVAVSKPIVQYRFVDENGQERTTDYEVYKTEEELERALMTKAPPELTARAREIAAKNYERDFGKEGNLTNALSDADKFLLDEAPTKKQVSFSYLRYTLSCNVQEGSLDTDNPNYEQHKKELSDFLGTNELTSNPLVIQVVSSNMTIPYKIQNDLKKPYLYQEEPAPEETPPAQTKTPDDINPLMKFMDPNNNSLVKSFEDSGGRGLAGVIESMDFNWLDQISWDTENKNNLAPMMCKVNISFSPIHDISPGLDSQGINRAPIYPVGPYMNPHYKK